MGFFDRLFGRKSNTGPDRNAPIPWNQPPSIYDFLRAHIDPEKPGLMEAGYTLPDEDRHNQGAKIRFAPGALDGIHTHHSRHEADPDSLQAVVNLLLRYCARPTLKNKIAVYEQIVARPILPMISQVIDKVQKSKELWNQQLYELAYSFATQGSDREPVKFGIAILALYKRPRTEALFQTLGRHEEFTVFCAISLPTNSENPDHSLWSLARNVSGWGRIHTVEYLAETKDPAIKDWLLRDGFRNSVGPEYLAAMCARSGGLRAALNQTQTDRELLTAAGEIIQALIAGGPADGIDEYEDAQPVIESYLGLMAARAETMADFLTVHEINEFLEEDDTVWAERYDRNWTIGCRNRLRNTCHSILGRPHWRTLIQTALANDGEIEFFHANKAAKALGIDTWDIHWKRLLEKPTESGRWWEVMVLCDENRIDAVIEIALSRLDLEAIATGPADEPGLGPNYVEHTCLDTILQKLDGFPLRGGRLIETGLKSPVVRNRYMAIEALAQWPRASWSPGLERRVAEAFEVEPLAEVKEEMQKLLRGEDLNQ